MPPRRRLSRALAALTLLGSLLLLPAVGAAGQEARPVRVRVTSATAAGVYTVGWRTLGNCNPGDGTSGPSGTLVLTVEPRGNPDSTPAPGELTGAAVSGTIVIRPFCVYTWRVSFVEATTGANCVVGPTPFAPDGDNRITITLSDPATSCSHHSLIVVRVVPKRDAADGHDRNAILATRFTATAKPVAGAPSQCRSLKATSELDDNDTPGDTTDDIVSIELDVIDTTESGNICLYDVTLDLPADLFAADEANVVKGVAAPATVDIGVGVATRTVYRGQTVAGESGGASVRYSLSVSCEAPMIPPGLGSMSRGGISRIARVPMVELREGRFNVTAALAEDPDAEGAADGIIVPVQDHEARACKATVSVSNVPASCVAEEASLTTDLPRAPDRIIVEFNFRCGAEATEEVDSGASPDPGASPDSGPVDESPAPEAPSEDGGDAGGEGGGTGGWGDVTAEGPRKDVPVG